jgi:hypothetical protein
VLFALLSGCAGLPEYALPRNITIVNDPAMVDHPVPYRQLTRSDFKASTLPAERALHANTINAYTCARIRPTKDSRFTIHRSRFEGVWTFFGGINAIGFEAVMLPGCSWWNPHLPPKKHSYTLQHEQIHFAIVELTARRLTAEVQPEAQSFLSIQPTRNAVQKEIVTQVNNWIQSAMTESLAMHTDFDEDTSMYPSPRWQKWWQEKIEKQLAERPPHATGKNRNERP